MRTIHRITVSTLAAFSLLAAYLLTAAATAVAGPVQPHERAGFPDLGPVTSQVAPSSTIVTTGSPWWTFVLIAAAAALVAVAATLIVTRLYHRSATRPAIV
jgi:ABC-type branched-subunit amino acid transport system permease subunit